MVGFFSYSLSDPILILLEDDKCQVHLKSITTTISTEMRIDPKSAAHLKYAECRNNLMRSDSPVINVTLLLEFMFEI